MFTERDELCKECWDEDKVPEGIHHCVDCGSFAQTGSKRCWRCARLQDYIKRVDELKTEKTVCQNKNVALIRERDELGKKVLTFKEKADYPFKLHVAEYNGLCNEGYLKTVLEAAGKVPAAVKVTYSRRK